MKKKITQYQYLTEVSRLQKLAGIPSETYNQRRRLTSLYHDFLFESYFREEEEQGAEGEEKEKKSNDIVNLDEPKGAAASQNAEKAIKSLPSVPLIDPNNKEEVMNLVLSKLPKDVSDKLKNNLTGLMKAGGDGDKDQQQENFRSIREGGIPGWISSTKDNSQTLKEIEPVSIAITAASLLPLGLHCIAMAIDWVSRQFMAKDKKQEYERLQAIIAKAEEKHDELKEPVLQKLKDLQKDKEKNKEEIEERKKKIADLNRQFKKKVEPIKEEIKQKFGTAFAKGLEKFGHAWHEGLIFPIRTILYPFYWGSGKFGGWRASWKATEHVANILYAVGMIVYACWFGLGPAVASGLSHLAGVGHVVHTILEGVEVGNSLKMIASSALELAKVA